MYLSITENSTPFQVHVPLPVVHGLSEIDPLSVLGLVELPVGVLAEHLLHDVLLGHEAVEPHREKHRAEEIDGHERSSSRKALKDRFLKTASAENTRKRELDTLRPIAMLFARIVPELGKRCVVELHKLGRLY